MFFLGSTKVSDIVDSILLIFAYTLGASVARGARIIDMADMAVATPLGGDLTEYRYIKMYRMFITDTAAPRSKTSSASWTAAATCWSRRRAASWTCCTAAAWRSTTADISYSMKLTACWTWASSPRYERSSRATRCPRPANGRLSCSRRRSPSRFKS